MPNVDKIEFLQQYTASRILKGKFCSGIEGALIY